MKKITNQQMGYVSSEEDRTIFQERENFIRTFSPFEKLIFDEFEATFAGNLVNGFSYSKILKSFLTDYQSLLNARNMDLSYWFQAIGWPYGDWQATFKGPVNPTTYNNIFSQDLRYKAMLREDGKLAPFIYCLGRTSESYYGNYSTPVSYTTRLFNDLVIGLKTAIPTTLANPYSATVTKFTNVTNSWDVNVTTNLGFFIFTRTASNAHFRIQIGSCATSFYDFDYVEAVNASPARIENFKIVHMVAPNVYMSAISPNLFISYMNNLISIIAFFEGESTAMNVDGDYSGLASNEYEVLLQEQLDYLNTMNDAVSQSLINEKIDSQKQKDELIAKIAQKKIDIEKYVGVKRQAIKNLNNLIAQKAELQGKV